MLWSTFILPIASLLLDFDSPTNVARRSAQKSIKETLVTPTHSSREEYIAGRIIFDHFDDMDKLLSSQTQSSNTPQTPPPSEVQNFTPVIVGIAGGSGSGKTTLTKKILDSLEGDHATYITHDNYYKDLTGMTLQERALVNFDHPDSLDTELLIEHIKALKAGKSVNIPKYDFKTHSRTTETTLIKPNRILIVDGILLFSDPELLKLLDMKIFVDTEDDIRLIRRIRRDSVERNRSVDSIIEQYTKTVRPMHHLFVEPNKRKADIIVPDITNDVAVDMCVSRLREIVAQSSYHQ